MVTLTDIAMIAADTSRSRVYIQSMILEGLIPNFVLILKNKNNKSLPGQIKSTKISTGKNNGIDLSLSIRRSLKSASVNFKEMYTNDIHDPKVIEEIEIRPEFAFIYSGYGGIILKKKLFSTGKKFLHIHGGYLPNYKGSTTNYYSIIEENMIGASSIFLNEKIDSGPIILRRKFPPPYKRQEMDHFYDSVVRSNVLIETLNEYQKSGKFKTKKYINEGSMYYIIHPLLKHISILSKK